MRSSAQHSTAQLSTAQVLGITRMFPKAKPEEGTRVCTRRMRFTMRVCPGPAAMLCPFLSAVSAWHSSSLSRLSCPHLSSSFLACSVNQALDAYIPAFILRKVVLHPFWKA